MVAGLKLPFVVCCLLFLTAMAVSADVSVNRYNCVKYKTSPVDEYLAPDVSGSASPSLQLQKAAQESIEGVGKKLRSKVVDELSLQHVGGYSLVPHDSNIPGMRKLPAPAINKNSIVVSCIRKPLINVDEESSPKIIGKCANVVWNQEATWDQTADVRRSAVLSVPNTGDITCFLSMWISAAMMAAEDLPDKYHSSVIDSLIEYFKKMVKNGVVCDVCDIEIEKVSFLFIDGGGFEPRHKVSSKRRALPWSEGSKVKLKESPRQLIGVELIGTRGGDELRIWDLRRSVGLPFSGRDVYLESVGGKIHEGFELWKGKQAPVSYTDDTGLLGVKPTGAVDHSLTGASSQDERLGDESNGAGRPLRGALIQYLGDIYRSKYQVDPFSSHQ